MQNPRLKKRQLMLSGAIALLGLSGCFGSDNKTAADAVVVEGDFKIVFVDRHVDATGNPTDGIRFVPGGDLYIQDLSSPSAQKINVTDRYTGGAGDVSDPEASFDATRVLFSMRGPNDATWNAWEYTIDTDDMRRLIVDDEIADLGDDVDPTYLPDGRIVFSSNRQVRSKEMLADDNTEPYAHLDEYERERAILLHVMDADGDNIKQISFNQSHDRNPTVLSTGEVMFARWDHVAGRNHFPIFFANPDGTNIFVQYGAFSPGNSMLHPREMPNGKVMTSLMPLSGTREGGALMEVDIRNFSENNQPAPGAPPGSTGQKQLTSVDVNFGRGISEAGRFTTPFPLWDGTDRALVSWSPFIEVAGTDPVSGDPMTEEGDPAYAIYVFDMTEKTLRPVALPGQGRALTDPIALVSRPLPNIISDKQLDQDLAGQNAGILNIKSVYDTDSLDIMGRRVLSADESLPFTAPPPDDTRSEVVDIVTLKDPMLTPADQRPARFVRVTKAVPTPPGIRRETIGETMFEMQQIVGYAPVEPDGSLRIKVPADTALTLAVLDDQGRAFQTHTNWLQVRPGETRTCNGCHSPRRGSALNAAPIAGTHPNVLMTAESGESMAETRTRLDANAMTLTQDLVFDDVWTDPAAVGRPADTGIAIRYSDLTTPAPVNGLLNYPDHIQALWEADRGPDTCVGCHNNNDLSDPLSAGLDLSNTVAGSGRLVSYEELMIGDPVFDPVTGLPVIRVEDGEVVLERETPLVEVGSSSESSRTSHLVEKIFETELRASQDLPIATVDHGPFMSDAERRLVAEWIDLGAQYFNDPFDDINQDGFRARDEIRGGVMELSRSTFDSEILSILDRRCAGCHRPSSGNNGLVAGGASFNRFVLTGNAEGDFNVSLSMVNDVCTPSASQLLARPSSDNTSPPLHPLIDDSNVLDDPLDPTADDVPVLAVGEPDYQSLAAWIQAGCTG